MTKKKDKVKNYTVGVTSPTDGLDLMLGASGFDVVVLPTFSSWKDELPELSMIAFSGGVDVSPTMYGQSYHPTTDTTQQLRDESDTKYFNYYKDLPKIGVCRGAQFLCVKGGGRLYQHITQNDHNKSHRVLDHATGKFVSVTSVHHQACIIKPEWTLIATATHHSMVEMSSRHIVKPDYYVPEAFYIPDTNSLCVQFHPEYHNKECETYFFELMQRVFN